MMHSFPFLYLRKAGICEICRVNQNKQESKDNIASKIRNGKGRTKKEYYVLGRDISEGFVEIDRKYCMRRWTKNSSIELPQIFLTWYAPTDVSGTQHPVFHIFLRSAVLPSYNRWWWKYKIEPKCLSGHSLSTLNPIIWLDILPTYSNL